MKKTLVLLFAVCLFTSKYYGQNSKEIVGFYQTEKDFTEGKITPAEDSKIIPNLRYVVKNDGQKKEKIDFENIKDYAFHSPRGFTYRFMPGFENKTNAYLVLNIGDISTYASDFDERAGNKKYNIENVCFAKGLSNNKFYCQNDGSVSELIKIIEQVDIELAKKMKEDKGLKDKVNGTQARNDNIRKQLEYIEIFNKRMGAKNKK